MKKKGPRHLMNQPRRHRLTALVFVAAVLLLQIMLGGSPAAASPFCDRLTPPDIDGWNNGMTGQLDPYLGSSAGNTGLRGSYGYGGQVWHTYDVGDAVTCTDPRAEISTWTGNQLFNGAKVMVATTNALNTMVEEQGLPNKLDGIVKTGAEASYKGFAAPLLGLVLLIIGIFVFRHVFSGDNAAAAKHGGRVAVGVTLIAATAFSPLLYSKLFDDVILGGYHEIQENIGQSLFGDVVFREVLPETLHKNIVENNFYAGAFGDFTSPLAQELGPQLVAAQSCNWDEVRYEHCDNAAKKEAFKKIAERVKNEGNYGAFTGSSGSRVGNGALALAEAAIITPLQAICKLGILFGQIILRFVVLFGGLIGLLCMMPGVGRTVARGVLGIGFLAIVFNGVAFFHTWLMFRILGMPDAELSVAMKMAAMFIITALIWAVMSPVKRMKQMVATAMHTMPGDSAHRIGSWIQHARLAHLLKKKGNSSSELRWWKGKSESGPGGQVLPGDREPAPYAYAASRPEGDDRPGVVLHRPGTGGVAGFPRSPGDAPGGDRSGGGRAAARPTIHVDAERVWDDDITPRRRGTDPGSGGVGGGETRTALPGGTRYELPAAEQDSGGSARPEAPDEPVAPDGGSTDAGLIRPSEVYDRDKTEPKETKPRFEGGKQVFDLYRPSDGVSGPDDEPSGPRPEAQDDSKQGPASRHDQQGGHDNAAEN